MSRFEPGKTYVDPYGARWLCIGLVTHPSAIFDLEGVVHSSPPCRVVYANHSPLAKELREQTNTEKTGSNS